MHGHAADVDGETAWLVQQLAQEGPERRDAATVLTIEKLRRLEDLARNAGTSRQAFQKIVSARRVLGDHAELGPTPDFTWDADQDLFGPSSDALPPVSGYDAPNIR